jgi:hypothetical protein
MLIERGFDLGSVSLDQKGPALEFSAAQAVAEQGGQAAAGDVADAIQKLLAIYDWIDSERRAP